MKTLPTIYGVRSCRGHFFSHGRFGTKGERMWLNMSGDGDLHYMHDCPVIRSFINVSQSQAVVSTHSTDVI